MRSKYSFIFLLLVFIGACTPDNITPVIEPPFLTPKQTCIVDTISDDSTSGFVIMDPGSQEHGRAEGIKINQSFESGLRLIYSSPEFPDYPDSIYAIRLSMIWTGSPDSLESESFTLYNVPIYRTQSCFQIFDRTAQPDSVYTGHLNFYFDSAYMTYVPDSTFDNYLYVDTFDIETGFFHGYFSARMIGDTSYLPELPRVVEYINVEMTAP